VPNLKDYVEALQAGWFPALASLVGCSIIVAGDWFKVPYLSANPEWLINVAVYVGVFSFAVLVANLVYLPLKLWRALKRRRERKLAQEAVNRRIEQAPDEEKGVLAYLVTTNRQAFTAKLGNPQLAPMVSKGLIVVQPGQHSRLEWPHVVPDVVWDILIENREAFELTGANEMPYPFDWRRGKLRVERKE